MKIKIENINISGNNKRTDLSGLAETLLTKSDEHISHMLPQKIKKLVHELDAHQIGLKLQNEDLRKVQDSLEESKDNYYELFDLAPCGYLKLNQKGSIIQTNLTATKILAIDKVDLINKKFTDFILDEFQDEFYKIYSKHDGCIKKGCCDLKLKNKIENIWVHLELCRLNTIQMDTYSYLITINDITEQKEMQLFNDLTRNIKDAIFFINPDNSKFIDVNEEAVRSLGYTRKELLTMGVVDIETVISDEVLWKKHVKKVYEKGTSLIEGLHRRKDGTVFPVEVSLTTANYINREYMIATARDVTERKESKNALNIAEKQVKNMTEKLKSILKNIPEVIYSVKADLTLSILYISDRWEDWTGYSPEDCYTDSEIWLKSIHPDDKQATLLHYEEVILKGMDNISEYRLINRKNGEVRWVYDHGIPIKNKKGRTIRYDGIVTDISDRKKAEHIMTQSHKMHAVGTLAGVYGP